MNIRLRPFIEQHLRRLVFPRRNHAYSSTKDSELRIWAKDQVATSTLGADAELELDTRQWLRDFWTRSLVAWLALLVSAAAFTLAICSYNLSLHIRHSADKGKNEAAK